MAMGNRKLQPYRARAVSGARGTVLDIGIGSGRNLLFYGAGVNRVIGLDPSVQSLTRAGGTAQGLPFDAKFIVGSAERIPLENNSIDTLVMTWTLCSIPDARKALMEMRRVLKPGGFLLFAEHGLAPEKAVREWQRCLDPLWWKISCHLERPVDTLVRSAGFRLEKLQSGYLGHGPKSLTYMYEGTAVSP